MPWERLHEIDPPFVPLIRSPDDTQYFNEEEPITDFSDSDDDDDDDDDEYQPLPQPETSTTATSLNAAAGRDGAGDIATSCNNLLVLGPNSSSTSTINHTQKYKLPELKTGSSPRNEVQVTPTPEVVATNPTNTTTLKKRANRKVYITEALRPFSYSIQHAVRSWLAVPYDSLRLRNFELQVDAEPGLRPSERDALKALVRMCGRKEKKRPRDRLLRDPLTKKVVLEERKKTAFMGYDWQRIQGPPMMPMITTGLPALPRLDASAATEHDFAMNQPGVAGANGGD